MYSDKGHTVQIKLQRDTHQTLQMKYTFTNTNASTVYINISTHTLKAFSMQAYSPLHTPLHTAAYHLLIAVYPAEVKTCSDAADAVRFKQGLRVCVYL